MLKKVYSFIAILLLTSLSINAQSGGGAIKVLLKDKGNGETIPFANVVAYQNGVQVGVGTTDMDGYAVIKPLAPGKYDIKGVYVGYQAKEIKGVQVSNDKTTYQTIDLENGEGVKLDEVLVVEYQEPLIDPDTKSGGTVTREEYQNMATKNIKSVAATTAGVFQADEGADINVRGGRTNATTYFVDGVKVLGGMGVPQQGVEQIQVITGGLPAQYGDATSGVISVTTRGPQSKFFGGVELISSQLTDKYGYNSLGFSVGGPIIQKKDSAGNKTPIVGFILSGQGTYEKDPDPSYVKLWQVNPDKLKELEDAPLNKKTSSTGDISFDPKANYITKADMYETKVRPNAASRAIQLNGKLDFKISQNTNLTIGGAFDYVNKHNFAYNFMLFNASNNSQTIESTWRTFASIRQKFGSAHTASEKEKTQSFISNAYFTFLGSYEKKNATTQDDTHKDKIFRYGYQGKYADNYSLDPYNTANYAPVGHRDPLTGLDYFTMDYKGANYGKPSVVTFERAEYNPITANYSTQIFNELGSVSSIQDSRLSQYVNGARPSGINSLFDPMGRQSLSYSREQNTQLRFASNFSADIKNHAILIGFEYDQRVQRRHSVSAIQLWDRMRQLVEINSHISTNLDTATRVNLGHINPSINADYMYYSNSVDYSKQTQIDKSIRELLGLDPNSLNHINTDALNPNDLTLDMFSASDLHGKNVTGENLVDYFGYDYTGKTVDKVKTTWDRFLNNKDSKGNNAFSVGAYTPIYVAGYIQDKFDFKDIKFNVGVRVDRFDANQKTLKDPYLMHEAVTAGELNQERPSNIKNDYVVYVDGIDSKNIVGYRNDFTWYNAEGKEISDPNLLVKNGQMAPMLKDPAYAKAHSYSEGAFKDYKPQINIMPRVAFSFPISDIASFSAHYDVLTQRPGGVDNRFNPIDFYYLNESSNNPFIANSSLRPEKTVDYEVGYSQVLNEKKNAVLKINAFYREMRDMITVQTLTGAYPKLYQTYVNRDFGTVKGLSFVFELRRTMGLMFNANYTLQFADGSGSNANSGANLANSGQPNLRIGIPLDYDQRHNMVLTFDYRFDEGKDYRGPQWNKTKKDGSSQSIQFLKNTGANLQLMTGSGTPYTRTQIAAAVDRTGGTGKSSILGLINGSNKPWQFRANLRLDKNIELTWGKKEGQDAKSANLNIYLQVLNLLNTKNIQKVYSYTGNADDDGYLATPVGSLNNNTVAKQDQYNIYINNPNNYSRPRTIRIGVTLEF